MILYRKVLIMENNLNYESEIELLIKKFITKAIKANLKIVEPIASEEEYFIEISFSHKTIKCIGLHRNKNIAMKIAYEKALKEFNSLSD